MNKASRVAASESDSDFDTLLKRTASVAEAGRLSGFMSRGRKVWAQSGALRLATGMAGERGEKLVLLPFECSSLDDAMYLVPGDHEGIDARMWQKIWGSEPFGNTSFADWQGQTQKVLQKIQTRAVDKVVLLRRQMMKTPRHFSPSWMVSRLVERFPQCQTLWIHAGDQRDWICSSPEFLVSKHGGQIRSEALAGTMPRGRTSKQDLQIRQLLLTQPKLLREHQIVRDELYRQLEPVCRELLVPTEPEVLTLKNVHHLKTPLMGHESEPVTIQKLTELLHPTPALCGYPKAAAANLLRDLERRPRGWYGGPFGLIRDQSEGEMYVGMRAMLREGDRITLFAGAGIVEGSQANIEWQETEWKLQVLRSLLT